MIRQSQRNKKSYCGRILPKVKGLPVWLAAVFENRGREVEKTELHLGDVIKYELPASTELLNLIAITDSAVPM